LPLRIHTEAHPKIQSTKFKVSDIVLFESILSSSGPTRTRLASAPLSKPRRAGDLASYMARLSIA